MISLSDADYVLLHASLCQIAKGLELARSGILALDKFLENKQKGISNGKETPAGNHQTKSTEHIEVSSN